MQRPPGVRGAALKSRMLQDVLDTNEDTTLVGELQLKKLPPESNFGSATEQEAKLKTNEDVILSVVLSYNLCHLWPSASNEVGVFEAEPAWNSLEFNSIKGEHARNQ